MDHLCSSQGLVLSCLWLWWVLIYGLIFLRKVFALSNCFRRIAIKLYFIYLKEGRWNGGRHYGAGYNEESVMTVSLWSCNNSVLEQSSNLARKCWKGQQNAFHSFPVKNLLKFEQDVSIGKSHFTQALEIRKWTTHNYTCTEHTPVLGSAFPSNQRSL